MKVRARRITWSKDHQDAYVYSFSNGTWVRVGCVIGPGPGMRCTAPPVLPRGFKFDGTVMVPRERVELALASHEATACK
jgi:hypothetical protein